MIPQSHFFSSLCRYFANEIQVHLAYHVHKSGRKTPSITTEIQEAMPLLFELQE